MNAPRRTAISRLAESLIYALLTSVIAFFLYASFFGQHGLITQVTVRDELVVLQKDHARIQSEVEAMRNKTRRVSNDYLDLDLLDELARDLLGYIRVGEVIVN
ncbi:MAG: septum formation initiator family protein [Rhodobacteraceae bacterium]|nr:septum formation initiator family protein [Paracoccaceae bacterium]